LARNSIGILIKSLYKKPAKVAKNPIMRRRYLAGKMALRKLSLFLIQVSFKHSNEAAVKRRAPWNTSPNITPNRKGKLTMANMAGFTS
jgi:hypothetical protein